MSKQDVTDFSRHEGEARKLDRLLVRILKLAVIIVVLLVVARLMTGCGTLHTQVQPPHWDQHAEAPVMAVAFAMEDPAPSNIVQKHPWWTSLIGLAGVAAADYIEDEDLDLFGTFGSDRQPPSPNLAASAPKQNTASATGGGRITIRDADRVPDHIVAAGPGSVVDIDVHMGGK